MSLPGCRIRRCRLFAQQSFRLDCRHAAEEVMTLVEIARGHPQQLTLRGGLDTLDYRLHTEVVDEIYQRFQQTEITRVDLDAFDEGTVEFYAFEWQSPHMVEG